MSISVDRSEHHRRSADVFLASGFKLAMPELVPITNNFFVNLINRLGLKPPPGLGWLMSTVVMPVSIVDTDIALQATVTSIVLDTPFTAGVQTAPAVGFILADTGAQVAGNYALHVEFSTNGAAAVSAIVALERRNAANAANIWTHLWSVSAAGGATMERNVTVLLAASERIRVEVLFMSAGLDMQASIWLQKI